MLLSLRITARSFAILLLPAVIFAGVTALPPPASALEIVYFDAEWCAPCRKFKKEVLPRWKETELGAVVDLRMAEMKDQGKLGIELAEKVVEVPVFVLVDNGVEVGRVVGYATPKKFWAELREAIEQHGSEGRKEPD